MSLKIYSILCRAKTMANYSYLLIDEETGLSAIVDPSETAPIISKCNELNTKPSFVLNTHHHFDHTDSNLDLKNIYDLKVVGAEDRIPGIDIKVNNGDVFSLGNSLCKIIDVSAHTQGHILWYFEKNKALFTGDTLFNLCIGGLFEGSTKEMFNALKKIKVLPNDVLFYPGHEYTLHAARNAALIAPTKELQEYIENAKLRLAKGLPAHPVSLGLEKKANPYLLADNIEEFEKLF